MNEPKQCVRCGIRDGEPIEGEEAYGQQVLAQVSECLCQHCYYEQFGIFIHRRANASMDVDGYGGTMFDSVEGGE